MGIMDVIRGEFIEVIEWTDDSRDTLSWRFPDEDKAIKNGAQLIVRESQVAQFVYLGEFGDTFGPGKHTLVTDNIPVLTKIKSWPYAFNSPFKADVYYVTTRLFTGNKWGTSNPVMLRDADFGMVRVRAFGTYDFKIVQPKVFLKEVAGSDQNFHLDEFSDTMRSRIVSIFTDAVASVKVQVLDVDPMIVASGFAVVLVRMGVCRREAGGAQRVRMLVGVVVFAHHQNLGSTAPAIAMSAKSTIASPLFAPKRGSRSRSAPSESDPVAPRALAASSTRVARA